MISEQVETVDRTQLLHLYTEMLRVREFESHVRDLYERTLIPGMAHVSIGQEVVPVGICAALNRDDYITSTHRGHGHCLAKGAETKRMYAELFGKADGYCHGKGGSMHIADPETGNLGANAIVGGSLAIATGAGLSAKLKKRGQVAVCFFGDGASNQGLLLESMNIASIWALPVVYVCEHNQYGEYTPAQSVTAGSLPDRGKALNIPTTVVDGMDVLAVYAAAQSAVARARAGEGPSFLVCQTYRYGGHGMSDRDRPYRTREQEERWKLTDPIGRVEAQLLATHAANSSELETIRKQAEQEMNQAIEYGLAAAPPAPEEVHLHVYAN